MAGSFAVNLYVRRTEMAFFNNGLKNIELKLRRFAGKNNVFHKSFEKRIKV
jgi:hypothetical protein